MNVHKFSDTGTAYDASQCDDDIKDGDILLIQGSLEGVVIGFLMEAWPVAVVGGPGAFHTLETSATWNDLENGRYIPSVEKCNALASELEAAEETARLNRKMQLERSILIADAWAAQQARSLCTCGHSGDGNGSDHAEAFPGFAPGHGQCKVPGCGCVKFTWARFIAPAAPERGQ